MSLPFDLAMEQWQTESGCQELERVWDTLPDKDQHYEAIASLVEAYGQHEAIVDVGCASGRVIDYLPTFARYRGFDLSLHLLAAARERHQGNGKVLFIQRSLEDGANYKRPADVVLCTDLAHHYQDPLAMIRLLVERWPGRAYVVSLMHSPEGAELINGRALPTNIMMDQIRDLPVRVYDWSDRPLTGDLVMRYLLLGVE